MNNNHNRTLAQLVCIQQAKQRAATAGWVVAASSRSERAGDERSVHT